MIIKLHIKKAYDKVNWRFLFKTLEAFGFSSSWVNWIFRWIVCPRFSILINDTTHELFGASRGLRQWDPLSPFLFILMAEALGQAISQATTTGKLKGV